MNGSFGAEPASRAREPVGARLRRLRSERGLTQRALAQPHYTAAYVSSVESGKRTPSGDALRHFADRLGLDPEELLTGRSPQQVMLLDLGLVEAAQAFLAGRPDAARTRLRRLWPEADRLGQARQSGLARLWLARVELASGDLAAAEEHLRAAERALEPDTPPVRALAVPVRALVLAEAGEPHYATYLLQNCQDELLRAGYRDPVVLLALRALLADLHLRLGDVERAGECARGALRLARLGPEDGVTELIGHYAGLCRAQLAEDRFTDAAVAVAHAHDLVHELALRPAIARCLLARGRIRRLGGDRRGALADLRAARESAAAGDLSAITLELAEVNRELGRLDVAAELLDEVLRALGTDDPLAAAVRYEFGALALARADEPAAEEHFRAAIEVATRLNARGPLAVSLDRAGELLCSQHRLTEAADLLRDGLLTLGATPD
ncbi:helix-turn-helix domain-containing protein [Amycolatopsis anabasis]|uniref:helix-turn-helix domain-containing protein n=1 Tax=Amycolatopsis anabasis TaxID=1840409 RepID=UPI001FE63474|nr:helix-turn-helix domain-containing protein [Amycolatopsis anabasis]